MKSFIFDNMKKLLSLLLLVTFSATIFSCQDEFCLDATTPNLIIRFYDKDTITKTKSIKLIVRANSKDTLYNGINTDSLSIPLDTQNNNVTYHISILDNPNSQEDININYTTEDVFVSKACGFKSIFKDVSITTTHNNWLSSATPTSTFNITDQTQAHVKIFH
ncbi:hypothetical protein SAMN05444281_1524 [Wenyingzhuangia marina]|uniref:Uncharacterized protein n=2 Tax=Wenyingzhuangia marina TaxID=1195760 RepID=A0A1M5V5J3_9FLAO|nr:hypothetical protein GCM10011397_16530 [Wenyingzhuangia marina]SHH70456.1 hypothetical protein SAMN05444281_1524 [Wenyingzhuangia marina]